MITIPQYLHILTAHLLLFKLENNCIFCCKGIFFSASVDVSKSENIKMLCWLFLLQSWKDDNSSAIWLPSRQQWNHIKTLHYIPLSWNAGSLSSGNADNANVNSGSHLLVYNLMLQKSLQMKDCLCITFQLIYSIKQQNVL